MKYQDDVYTGNVRVFKLKSVEALGETRKWQYQDPLASPFSIEIAQQLYANNFL